jgi:DNA-binding NarL/FixJ family response regulator
MARALTADESNSSSEAIGDGAMLFVLDNFEQVARPPRPSAGCHTAPTRTALGAAFESEYARGRALWLVQARAHIETSSGAFSPECIPRISAPPNPIPATPTSEADTLSPREREGATAIGHGFTSEAIADALVISRGTVDTHAAHIRDKLSLRSRAEIAAWAIRHGKT